MITESLGKAWQQGTVFGEKGGEALCLILKQGRAFLQNLLGGVDLKVFIKVLDAEDQAQNR